MAGIFTMRKFINWLDERVGNRGELLIMLAIPWIILGLGFVFIPVERFSKPGPGGPLEAIDNGPFPAILWIVGGIIALVCAFTRIERHEDGYGFFGIIVPPFMWMVFYFISYISNEVSNGELGRPNTWIAGLLYLSIVLVLLFLSARFRDDPVTVRQRPEGY